MESDEGKITPGVTPSRGHLATVLILLICITGAVFIVSDWRQFEPVLAQADAKPLLAALALTALSYACISSAFAVVCQLLDIRMSFRSLTETGFVSITLNHVLTTGGVAGYSVRYLLMHRHGVALKEIVAASILHFYLTSVDMLTMLPVGFLYLFLNASLPSGVTALFGTMTLLMTIVAVLGTWLIFVPGTRAWFLRLLGGVVHAIVHRDLSEIFQRFDSTLARGIDLMRRKPKTILLLLILTWIDWFSSVGVVWFCFDALGKPLQFGAVLTSYVIGVTAGTLSMLPGGLGVQEGSMTGIFVLLGASFQQALLASILFRGIFFVLPYGVSMAFYGRLLRSNAPQT